jgi:uncharacterized sulfatase
MGDINVTFELNTIDAMTLFNYRYRIIINLVSGFLLCLILSNNGSSTNIIHIMVDDLGYGDLGCYGQKTVKTPNLDKMAEGGMKFTDYYSGNTVCRPSRLSLWTGKHMGHTPISSNANYIFKPEDITIAELLKANGYITGGVGKWAMGGVGTKGHPNDNGFEHWFGYLDQGLAHNYYPPFLWRNKEKVQLSGNVLTSSLVDRKRVSKTRITYSHDLMTTEALNFIKKNKGKPFLLHVHWTIPHANNEGGRATGDGMEVPDYGIYNSKKWPSVKKGAAAMITRMDKDVGKIINLLEELKIEEKTLVFFTSDNGPHSEGGHKHETFNSNGPLRGYKRDLYEGGIRVPAIAYWPKTIKKGTTLRKPLAFWDWFPTACDIANIKPPKDIDGLSFLPSLKGNHEKQKDHKYLFWMFSNKKAIRKGNWKGVITGPKKDMELYNLESDIGEEKNVAMKYPEKVRELNQVIKQYTK